MQQSLLWKPGAVEEAEEEDDSITQLPIENIVLRAAPGFDRVYWLMIKKKLYHLETIFLTFNM